MVVTICTTNPDKAALLGACLSAAGFDARHVARELDEPQAESVAAVVRAKIAEAFAALGGPIVVEDSGLEIAGLGGFPGPYTKYALATIGARGLVTLAAGQPCRFTSAIAIARSDGSIAVGNHAIDGSIATSMAGACDGSWSDVWRVFVPGGESLAFSELSGAARGAQLAAWRSALAAWLAAALRPQLAGHR
jgi:XTP/dITP diphosphohydrolase